MTDKLPGEGVEESLLARIQALRAENERLRNGDGLEYSLSLTNADLRAENERLKDEIAAIENAPSPCAALHAIRRAENERLRERVVMLLRCHYEEHVHHGPTCFDVQAPSDEWETAALGNAKAG